MLKEIFIINKAGIGLFYQNFEENGQKEKDMVSAFLKVIQDFSEEYMNQKLQEIHLGTNKVVLFSGDPVSFVIKVSSARSSNQLEARIKLLKDRFLQNYTPQIERNDTEISLFDPFEEEVRKVFKQFLSYFSP